MNCFDWSKLFFCLVTTSLTNWNKTNIIELYLQKSAFISLQSYQVGYWRVPTANTLPLSHLPTPFSGGYKSATWPIYILVWYYLWLYSMKRFRKVLDLSRTEHKQSLSATGYDTATPTRLKTSVLTKHYGTCMIVNYGKFQLLNYSAWFYGIIENLTKCK